MISYFKKQLAKLDMHTLEVVQKSSTSTMVKIAGMAIGLGASIFLGRTLGAEGLGIINLSSQIISILIVFGLLGMRQVIIKEIAIAHKKKDYKHIANVMHSAYLLNGGTTLILSVLLIFLSPWLANNIFNEPRLTYPLMIALLAMTPQVFSQIFSSALIGYRKIWQSNLADQTLSTGIVGLLLIVLWLFKKEITINIVALCYGVGRVIVTICVGIYWRILYPFNFKKKNIHKELTPVAFPLLIANMAIILISSFGAIFLGVFGNSKDIGLYTVASSLALLTSFFLQITNASVGPKIAALYESGKIKEVEKMVQQITRGLLIIGIIPLIIFIIAGSYILTIWGNEFREAYFILIILSIGQLVNIGTGSIGQLLIMTGYHIQNTKITFIFMLINIPLNILFIILWGAVGAAIANMLTISGLNISKAIISKQKTGVTTLTFI